MGIRINKAIGYSLGYETTDDVGFEYEPAERLIWGNNTEASEKGEVHDFVFSHHERIKEENGGDDPTTLGFQTCANPDYEKWYPKNFRDCIKQVDREYDSGNQFFIFMPPLSAKSWYRYDDHIDYIELSLINDGAMENDFRLLKSPLYPYVGIVDSRTGKPLDTPYLGIFEKNEFAMPEVPLVVQLMFKEIYPDKPDNYYLKLRPMLCTWWS